MPGTRIFLVDNGSYEPAATLALRGLAQEVGKLIGQEVRAVSTMHSTKIDPALLGGVPAVIFEGAVQQAKLEGIEEIVVIPLFIGPSRAITEYLPKVFADAQPGAMKLSMRDPLFGPELISMLIDNLKSTGWTKGSGTVYLCDHGSPIPEVTRCRNFFASVIRTRPWSARLTEPTTMVTNRCRRPDWSSAWLSTVSIVEGVASTSRSARSGWRRRRAAAAPRRCSREPGAGTSTSTGTAAAVSPETAIPARPAGRGKGR